MESNKKSLLKKASNFLSELFNAEPEANETAESTDLKLMDVTVTVGEESKKGKIETATEGEVNTDDVFYLVDDEGAKIDTPEGEYLIDGMTITVDADGKITNVVHPDVPVDEEMKKKVFSKYSRENFTVISEISKWSLTVENTSFELNERVYWLTEDTKEEINVNDGEYELEDGTKIFVNSEGIIVLKIYVDGKVESIDSVESAEDAPEAEPVDEELSAEEKELIANAEKAAEEFKKMKVEFEAIKNEKAELLAQVEELSKQPSAEHTKTTVEFKTENKTEKKGGYLSAMLKK